jgi:hypothetical protein
MSDGDGDDGELRRKGKEKRRGKKKTPEQGETTRQDVDEMVIEKRSQGVRCG